MYDIGVRTGTEVGFQKGKEPYKSYKLEFFGTVDALAKLLSMPVEQ